MLLNKNSLEYITPINHGFCSRWKKQICRLKPLVFIYRFTLDFGGYSLGDSFDSGGDSDITLVYSQKQQDKNTQGYATRNGRSWEIKTFQKWSKKLELEQVCTFLNVTLLFLVLKYTEVIFLNRAGRYCLLLTKAAFVHCGFCNQE